jgi:hypothetical protein
MIFEKCPDKSYYSCYTSTTRSTTNLQGYNLFVLYQYHNSTFKLNQHVQIMFVFNFSQDILKPNQTDIIACSEIHS